MHEVTCNRKDKTLETEQKPKLIGDRPADQNPTQSLRAANAQLPHTNQIHLRLSSG